MKIKILVLIIFYLISFFNLSHGANSEKVDQISKNLRCLICQGQSVYDSQSDFALSMKILIQNKIDEGKNDPNRKENRLLGNTPCHRISGVDVPIDVIARTNGTELEQTDL